VKLIISKLKIYFYFSTIFPILSKLYSQVSFSLFENKFPSISIFTFQERKKEEEKIYQKKLTV
jgi:hypothetical protein